MGKFIITSLVLFLALGALVTVLTDPPASPSALEIQNFTTGN